MVSYDNEDAIVVTEPTEIEVAPAEGTAEGSRGVSGPIINNAGGPSETPSNLVAEGKKPELSPNPAGFGFTKQRTVDELPEQGEPNTVYLLNVYNNGTHIGYRIFKWTPSDGYTQFGATPDLKLEKGAQEQKAIEVNVPKQAPEKVFAGEVVFLQEPTIKGKKLSDYIDSVGGVTEAELQAAVTELQNQINTKQDALTTTSVPEGTATRLIGFDSQGHPVNSPLPEGTVVVDTELDDQSTNPVQNKVVTEELNKKANVDGNYPTLTAGLADNLNTKIVQNEKEAYLFRTTGGSLEVGNNCKEKGIVGGSIGFNQLVQNGDFSNGLTGWSYNGITDESTTGNVLTFTATDQYAGVYKDISVIKNHKYLVAGFIKSNSANVRLQADERGENITYHRIDSAANNKLEGIFILINIAQDNASVRIGVSDTRSSDWDEVQATNFQIIDLTAMFGETIADYIYSLEQGEAGAGVAWFRRYFNKPYYPYTAIGAFNNVKTSGKKVVGFNQFAGNSTDNPQYIGHYYIDSNDGYQKGANASYNCFRIKVLPNTTYCFVKETGANIGTEGIWRFVDEDYNLISGIATGYGQEKALYTTPSNCAYIEFSVGTSATYGLNLNFHYDGERDGEYEPYESETYANDNIELIGIPKIDAQGNLYYEGNIYRPDGTVEKKFGIVNLGSLSWTQNQEYPNIYSATRPIDSKANDINLFSPNYKCNPLHQSLATLESGEVYFGGSNANVNSGSGNTPNGWLIYELATPTEDSATPYPENQPCDNWGTEERIDTRSIPIPVGHDTDYPLDLKSKLEILPDSPSDDGTYVVKAESGVNTYISLATWLSDNGYVKPTNITGYDATKTQVLKNVEGTLTWVDEE